MFRRTAREVPGAEGAPNDNANYVGQIDDDVLADVKDGGLYDVDVFGSVGVATTF
jgi:hypothetical protein